MQRVWITLVAIAILVSGCLIDSPTVNVGDIIIEIPDSVDVNLPDSVNISTSRPNWVQNLEYDVNVVDVEDK